MADIFSVLRRQLERLAALRRERPAWSDVRRQLAADAAVLRAAGARVRAWLSAPPSPRIAAAPSKPAMPRWHVGLRAGVYGLATLLILILGSIVYFIFEIPIDGGTAGDAQGALTIDAADGGVLAARGTVHGEQLAYDDISPNLRKAIVAIEDRRFFSHGAVDLHGLLRAVIHDLHNGHAQGASTITQQLARLMLLSNERTLRRKVQEALVAVWLEHHLTKREILARYLDAAYFGAGAYGADAAAERYFGTSARDLTLAQAAMIAGLVRAPSQLAPVKNLDGAQARAGVVLHAMVETGAITSAEADAAVAHPAVPKVAPDLPQGPGYVADAVQADVKALVGGGAQDLTARTTIDEKIQAAAETAIETHLAGEGARRHATQAALVAIGRNGAILAMVGGRDYAASPYDRATQAMRQPGSLFKLFVYLTALKAGATPQTIVDDAPVTIGTGTNAWQPHDFENRYEGRMPLSLAFARSINTVAAKLGQEVGIKAVIKTARDLGVTTPLPDVPSLALGTADVTLMEMTRAYAAIAADEDTIEPYLVQRITSHGKVLFNRPPRYGEQGEPSQAKLDMRELLADVVREGTGRGARLAFPTSGKTGTTQDFHDAWFIGSTPDVTIGVWVGNDDGSAMDGVTGGDLPVKIWRDVAVAAETAMGGKTRRAPQRPQVAAAPAPEPSPRVNDLGAEITGAVADTARGVIAEMTPHAAPDVRPEGDDPGAGDLPGTIAGAAQVVDTGTLAVGGQQLRLQGVAPLGGRAARELARYLRRRDVACTPAAAGTYRCDVDGDDLATTILSNGGAETTSDAPPDLVAAQEAAQDQGLGIWRGRR